MTTVEVREAAARALTLEALTEVAGRQARCALRTSIRFAHRPRGGHADDVYAYAERYGSCRWR